MRGEVGAKDAVAVAKEDAEPERFAVLVDRRLGCLGRDTEVDVEVTLERREPRDGPPHALPVRLDLRERGAGHEGKRGVAGCAGARGGRSDRRTRSEEHTSELQSRG